MELTTHAYIIYFGMPVLIFLSVVLVTLKNNSNAVENRLLAGSFFLYLLLFIVEWYRHYVPLNHSPFISTWLIGFLMILAIILTVHVCMILYERHTKKPSPIPVWLIYLGLVAHLFIALSPISPTIEHFYQDGIWIRRNAVEYSYWVSAFVYGTMLINLFFCYKGYKLATSKKGKQLFTYLGIIIPINSLLISLIISLTPKKFIPSIPSFYVMVTLSLFILIGIQKFNLFPRYDQRYVTMFQTSPICIIILTESCDVLEANELANKYFLEDVTGKNFHIMMEKSNNVQNVLPLFDKLREKEEVKNLHLSMNHFYTKKMLHFLVNAVVIEDNGERYFYIMFRDRTLEVQQQEEIKRLAYYDALTGLPNRAAFMQFAKQQFHMHEDIAIVLIDLNDFKQVNDRLGHAAGDEVLIKTGSVLKNIVGTSHLAARLGGDEFILFIHLNALTIPIDEYLEKLKHEFLHAEVKFENQTLTINPSIGYAIKSNHETLDELMHLADQEMYKQKALLKNL